MLENLVEPEIAGDPISGLKWLRITPAFLAEILRDSLQIEISPATVTRLLKELGFNLRANRKDVAHTQDPDRNEQFEIIWDLRDTYEAQGDPIISVDTKKRELIGLFKNPGRKWDRNDTYVYDHDFPSWAEGIAIPYGIYDLQANEGSVFVGVSHDTAEFAVNSIAKWWCYRGRHIYPKSRKLLILADSGGSNDYRSHAWKLHLQQKLCDRHGLIVTVAHYPSGASKWNPVEHRLFSEISKNWAAKPLESYEIMLNYIGATNTSTGLTVRAYLDQRDYPTGIQIPKHAIDRLTIQRSNTLPKWNYSLFPGTSSIM